jgi:hypothetical protein
MNKYLPLILPAAAAALLIPAAMSGRASPVDRQPGVQRAQVLAAADLAEAQRKAAEPAKAVPPATAAAELDKVAGAAERIDPERIDPKVALGAIAR